MNFIQSFGRFITYVYFCEVKQKTNVQKIKYIN